MWLAKVISRNNSARYWINKGSWVTGHDSTATACRLFNLMPKARQMPLRITGYDQS